MLSFLDFFQTSVQRTAVATAANMCRGLSSESIDAVAAAVPILTNLLQYEVGVFCPYACGTTVVPPFVSCLAHSNSEEIARWP